MNEQKQRADELKSVIKKGYRIRLVEMTEDMNPLDPGSEGTVDFVDDMGQIHVIWDNGRYLALIPEVDTFEVFEA